MASYNLILVKTMTEQPAKEDFRNRLRKITDFALRHASDRLPGLNQHSGQEEVRAYIRTVWEGWKWAQACILEELVQISMGRTVLQQLKKDASKNRNQDLANWIGIAIRNLDHKEAILRTVANSMIWAMFRSRRWIVRRLWAKGQPVPVASISRETTLYVHDVNESPDSVALMADITSLVDVGDVIVAHLGSEHPEPYIIELKEGDKNDRIVSMVEEYGTDSSEVPPEVLDGIDREIGPHGRKQFERIGRQIRRARNFASIANDDFGEDPETGKPMQNIGPELEVATYDARLSEIMFAAAKTGSAVDCIDGCLWVGVYYSTAKEGELQENFLRQIADGGATRLFPVRNLLRVSTDPRLQPMFLRDLAPESILDIMLGDVQILVYIDWDAFFQLANQTGISARWTTKRERKEITENYYQERAFRLDARTPVMERDGAECKLMGGAVARIVNEGLSPLCLLEMVQMTLSGWDEPDDDPG